jgi:hypothetical protein
MGVINITVQGSFRTPTTRQFSAMKGGHAKAVADAMEFLSGELLPDAIKQDHKLHDDEAYPEDGFGFGKQ